MIWLYRQYWRFTDRWFDFRNNVDTCSEADSLRPGCFRYHATPVLLLRRVFQALSLILPPKRVLVDYGCGKGRVLMIAQEFGFMVRGVELNPELCRIARANGDHFIHEGDAADYEVAAEENLFFLFNPFDGTVLQQVMDRIDISLREAPRQAFIVYANPRYRGIIDARRGWLRFQDWAFPGWRFAIYSNIKVTA